jgi:hypothetical protein
LAPPCMGESTLGDQLQNLKLVVDFFLLIGYNNNRSGGFSVPSKH